MKVREIMALNIVKKSGSLPTEIDSNAAVPVEDGADILRICAGGCGKKILFFGFPETGVEWSAEVAGALCLECTAHPLKHTPVNVG